MLVVGAVLTHYHQANPLLIRVVQGVVVRERNITVMSPVYLEL
jgi:hypothetical protein